MDQVEKETFFKPVKGIHNPRAAITFGGEALGTSSLKPLYGQEQIKDDHLDNALILGWITWLNQESVMN